MNMIDEKLAYIAGFWEGEGHAGLHSKGRSVPKKRLEVGITQKNPKVLFWIKSVFGYGHIRLSKSANNPIGVYLWRVRDKKAKDFLRRIYPFAKFRDKQIRALMI